MSRADIYADRPDSLRGLGMGGAPRPERRAAPVPHPPRPAARPAPPAAVVDPTAPLTPRGRAAFPAVLAVPTLTTAYVVAMAGMACGGMRRDTNSARYRWAVRIGPDPRWYDAPLAD